MKNITCKVPWARERGTLTNRVLLFCIDGDCMSGRVYSVTDVSDPGFYEIKINFIDPDYFNGKAGIGKEIIIQESSRVLGIGIIIRLD
ncbi:MAG: hypothetical protein AAFY76_03615 [Cyanobacteria bacterium J06649_11]